MQTQSQTEWCWATVSVSINLYYDPMSTWTQCKLANSELGQTDCCTNGGSSGCNQDWYLDSALQKVGNFSSWSAGKASLASVQNEIDNCRPFGLRIGWYSGGGHFVAVYGYSDSTLNIADPLYGNSLADYDTFPDGYPKNIPHTGGSWTDNYYTQS